MAVPLTSRSRLIATALALASCWALAVQPGSAASHKPRRAVPAANPHETDTSATGTLPTKAQPKRQPAIERQPAFERQPEVATAPADDETLPPPFRLPSAPRSRIRDCGLKWQAMKASGEVGEEIWRDFATRCLAAASGPLDKRSER